MHEHRNDMPGIDAVHAAAERIAPLTVRTPLVESARLAAVVGHDVLLKLETLQASGSFKARGAANAILAARERGGIDGVVAASTGNHAIAVAHVARALGLPAAAFVATDVGADRVRAIEALGASVHRVGETQAVALEAAAALAAERGWLLVPPFDHPDVIAGAGTIGLELVEQLPALGTVLVPVSGGGLAAGVGLAIAALKPDAHVIGVGAAHAASMRDSLAAGRSVSAHESPTVADSLLGDLGPANRWTLELVRTHVDAAHVVGETAIVDAMAHALEHERLVLEGAAAAPLAWLEAGGPVHGTTVAVATGSRVQPPLAAALAATVRVASST